MAVDKAINRYYIIILLGSMLPSRLDNDIQQRGQPLFLRGSIDCSTTSHIENWNWKELPKHTLDDTCSKVRVMYWNAIPDSIYCLENATSYLTTGTNAFTGMTEKVMRMAKELNHNVLWTNLFDCVNIHRYCNVTSSGSLRLMCSWGQDVEPRCSVHEFQWNIAVCA